ncbi:MAG: hypothetical protein AB7P16_28635 [Bradyrhizobium sp.]|uniref:hypothetical protein n=1 Tax=Bradyrhizobium sp. TaxID=376 RepID=UPI003D151CA9
MSPEAARGMYRRQIARHGETVTLRRINSSPTAPTNRDVRARVLGYTPDELVGEVQQGDRKIIVLAEDMGSFPVPFRERSTDRVIVRGAELAIQAVDDSTRRVAGELIAYEIRARG